MSLETPGKPLNLTDRFLDENIRAGRGERTAIIVDHPERGVEKYTYLDVARLSSRYGHELRARGIGIEDRVFIVLDDGIEWAAAFFGAMKAGATVMFLNTAVTAEELAFYMADSRARGVVTTREVAQKLPASRPYLKTVLEVDDRPAVARPSHILTVYGADRPGILYRVTDTLAGAGVNIAVPQWQQKLTF